MANAVVTLKIMPTSPDSNLDSIKESALEEIRAFNGNKDTRVSIEPIAFGLNAINIIFVMDESLGNPDAVSEKVAKIDEVNSAEITDVRRAVG